MDLLVNILILGIAPRQPDPGGCLGNLAPAVLAAAWQLRRIWAGLFWAQLPVHRALDLLSDLDF
jgi:hypothetical protein